MPALNRIATDAQIAHVTSGLTKFVEFCKARAAESAGAGAGCAEMYTDDATYNNKCLQEFLEHKNLHKLFGALIYQDTAPREEALGSFVYPKGSKELGFTWDNINASPQR